MRRLESKCEARDRIDSAGEKRPAFLFEQTAGNFAMTDSPRDFLTELYEAAVAAADPKPALAKALPESRERPAVVLGAGKGAAQLARAFEELWTGPVRGIAVTRYGFGVPCEHVRVLEAAHPVPDENGIMASRELMNLADSLGEKDFAVALITGGGSALLPMPPKGMTLDDEILLNEILLKSGAPISAMNAIRKQFSGIKGGRLAAATWPAEMQTYIVSDVPGDDPAQVASGPTVPDSAGPDAALAAINRYAIDLPGKFLDRLSSENDSAPRPGAPEFKTSKAVIIASAELSLVAALAKSRSLGTEAKILSVDLEGEAREAGRFLASVAKEVRKSNRPFEKPVAILSGGETTVTVKGSGQGGPNTETMLSFALEIDGCDGIYAMSADTDGVDGMGSNAGAFADGCTIERIRRQGLDPVECLAVNDSKMAMAAAGDLLETGPTGTNVNDFRAILVV